MSSFFRDIFSISVKPWKAGALYTWGNNDRGQIASGTTTESSNPVKPDAGFPGSWSQIAYGDSHAIAIRSDGTLWSWGSNSDGQLGIVPTSPTQEIGSSGTANISTTTPYKISDESWVEVSAKGNNSYAIKADGTLWAWGDNTYGQIGNNSTSTSPFLNSWNMITQNGSTYAAIRNDNTLWVWGDNTLGELGQGDTNHRSSPVQIGGSWNTVSLGSSHAAAIRTDGSLWTWGRNDYGQLGIEAKTRSWSVVSGRYYNVFGIDASDGSLWAWGQGQYVNADNGIKVHRSSPVLVSSESWTTVSSGGNFDTYAIKADGTLWTWNKSSSVQIGTSSWSQVSAFLGTAAAIRSDGALFTWGDNDFGQLGLGDKVDRDSPIQVGTSSWSQVSVGLRYITAIKSDGTLWTWGRNTNGQLGLNDTISRSSPVQIGTSSWSMVSAGMFNTSAIRADGRLFAWGINADGQLGQNNIIHRSSPVQVGTSSWAQVNSGYNYIHAITVDGKLFGWGSNAGFAPYVLGDGTLNYRSSPVQISAGRSFTSVGSGFFFTHALDTNNLLYTWGGNTNNIYGQLGQNTSLSYSVPTLVSETTIPTSEFEPVKIGKSSWVSVSAGSGHTLAINPDGKLYAWGYNAYGQLGSLDNIKQWNNVAAGRFTNYAVRSDGTLWSWGLNTNGDLGLGDTIHRSSPVQVGVDTNWSKAIAGSNGGGIKTDGTLWLSGINSHGQLGQNDRIHRSSPVQIGTDSWLTAVSSYLSDNILAIKSDGTLWTWGRNTNGQLGLNDRIHRSSPIQIGTESWSLIALGVESSYGIKSDGTLWAWGYNNIGQLGTNNTIHRSSPVQVGTSSWSTVVSGYLFAAGITVDGLLYTWGTNGLGQLGTNDRLNRSAPVQIGTSSWISIDAGYDFMQAIRSDGTLWSWGLNVNGQLGLNDAIARSSPVQVGLLNNWIKLSERAGGSSHAVAIDSNNNLFLWGGALYGVLGDSTSINRSSPVQLGAFINSSSPTLVNNTSWVSVDAGDFHSVGISTDNKVYSWGINNIGQLGDGTNDNKISPSEITHLNSTNGPVYSWSQVSSDSHTLAIRSDGTLWAWGFNMGGQLGTNDTIHRSNPVQISTESWKFVSVGGTDFLPIANRYGSNSFAIKGDNTLWVWGGNDNGSLGLNDTNPRSSPVQIGTDSWSMISSNDSSFGSFAIGIKNDGTLWSWGNNSSGQLGLSDLIHRSSPVQIGTSSWTMVSAGGGFVNAIRVGGGLFSWGDNRDGQLGSSTRIHRSSPVQVGTSSWSMVSSGNYYTAAIDINKRLFTWGWNSRGELGSGTILSRSSPVQVGTSSWNAVNAGIITTTATRADGTLWSWGANGSGALGDGISNSSFFRSSPVQVGYYNSWSILGNDTGFSRFAIDDKGTLWAWGSNTTGQLGLNDTIDRYAPMRVGSVSWSQIAAGSSHTTALSIDGIVFSWGANSSGQLNQGTLIHRSVPSVVGQGLTWNKINSKASSTQLIDNNGNAYVVGSFTYGLTEDGRISGSSSNLTSIHNLGKSWSFISGPDIWTIDNEGIMYGGFGSGTGALYSLTYVSSPRPYAFGVGKFPLDVNYEISPVQIGTSSWNHVAAGRNFATAIRSDGTLWNWGNIPGTANIAKSSPIQIGTSNSWNQIDAGDSHVIALDTNKQLYAWGYNDNYVAGPDQATLWASGSSGGNGSKLYLIDQNGKLFGLMGNSLTYGYWDSIGDNTTQARSALVQLGDTSWSQVATGLNFNAAIRSDGALFTWGANDSGQLGQNDTIHRSSPVQVGTSSWTMVSITEGGGQGSIGHMFAIRSDGTLFSWGANGYGNLGLGNTINRSSPVQVGTSSWTMVSANFYGGHAIRADGTLWGWGNNTYGEVGDNTTINRSSPVQVSGGGSWIKIHSSGGHAIKGDGTLWGWGYNFNGSVGDNTTINRSSPVQIATGSWKDVSFYKAIKSDGTLWEWYYNSSLSPIQSGIESDWDKFAGQYAAIKNDSTAYILTPFTKVGKYSVPPGSSPVQIGVTLSPNSLGTTSFNMISAGTNHNLALDTSDYLYTWGNYAASTINTTNTTSWSQISIGNNHTLAIKSDGSLWAWGENEWGQVGISSKIHRSSPVQLGTSSWNFVAAGVDHSLAIKNDGTLWGWGRNSYGELGENILETFSWTQVKNSSDVSMALRDNNTLWAWGWNSSGQLGTNDTSSRSSPVGVGGGIGDFYSGSWKQITGDDATQFAIKSDGTLWGWGNNTIGQLLDGTTITRTSPIQVIGSSWTMVSSDGVTVLAIRTDGTLWGWGSNTNGKLGLGDTINRSSPVQIGTSSWSFITSGELGSAGILVDGSLYVWGSGNSGRIGDNDISTRLTPTKIGTSSWTMVSSFSSSTYAIRIDGALFSWGNNTYGQLGQNNIIHRSSPVQVGTSSWSQISSDVYSVYGILSNKTLWSWGYNIDGQLGQSSVTNRSAPVQIGTSSWNFVTAKGNINGANAIRLDNTLWSWGIGAFGSNGDSSPTVNRSSPVQIGSNKVWSNLSDQGSFAIDNKGRISAWGNISSFNEVLFIPTQIGLEIWKDFAVGPQHAIAIHDDGTLWGWGNNTYGEVGDNTLLNRSAPIQINTDTNWKSVAVGLDNSFAIKNDGTLWGWGRRFGYTDKTSYNVVQATAKHGTIATTFMVRNSDENVYGKLLAMGYNDAGQLGLGDTIHRSSPTQIGTNDWLYAESSLHTLAIRSDGTLWAWGSNTTGQLGQNNIIHRSSPVQVGTSSWTMLAVGLQHSLAIKSDGTLWAWGSNSDGQLGQSNTIHRSSPVQIGTSSWTVISAGNANSIGITVDGTMWAWGNNTNGLLGQSDRVHRSAPVQIGADKTWSTAYISGSNAGAITTLGQLFLWGVNANGQLGQNDTIFRSSPVQVGTSSWSMVAINYGATIATQSDGTLWSWGNNTNGLLGQSNRVHRSAPVQIGTNANWSKPSITNSGTAYAINSKNLFTWGYLAMSDSTLTSRSSPVMVTEFYGTYKAFTSPTQIATMSSWTMVTSSINNSQYAIDVDGKLWAWGDTTGNSAGFLNTEAVSYEPTLVSSTRSWRTVATQDNTAYGIYGNYRLAAWGSNTHGQLGINSAGGAGYNNAFAGSWSSIRTNGGLTVLATRTDGTLWAWGNNTYGQLGLNDTISRSSPVQIGTDSWTQVFSTQYHIHGIRNNKLFTWGGDDSSGELGIGFSGGAVSSPVQIGTELGTKIHRSSPVQIGTDSWSYIGTGWAHTLGIKTDGTLWAWGDNTTGALGNNIKDFGRSSPVQISTSSWLVVSAGGIPSYGISAAIRSDGTLWTWGYNNIGQLGQNDTNHRSSPVQMGTESWSQVSVSSNHMAAIRTDGTLWTWGQNQFRQLGQNDTNHRSSPVQIGTNSYIAVSTMGGDTISETCGATYAINSNYGLELYGNYTFASFGSVNFDNGKRNFTSLATSKIINLNNLHYFGMIDSYGNLITKNNVSAITPAGLGTNGIRSENFRNIDFLAGYIDNNIIRNYTQLPTQYGMNKWSYISAGEDASILIDQNNVLYNWGRIRSGDASESSLIDRRDLISVPTQTDLINTIKVKKAVTAKFNSAYIKK